MINIAICDDDMFATSYIENLIEEISKKNLINLDIDIFFDGEKLSNYCLDKTYDIIFLDFKLNGQNGLDTAQKIRSCNDDLVIIFVSSYTNYLMELFEVSPLGFIQKPIVHAKFEKLYLKAIEKIRLLNWYYFFRNNKDINKILIKDIMYFESYKRTVNIITTKNINKEKHLFYEKLDNIEAKLIHSKFSFIRINQSYLVNLYYITTIGYNKIKLIDGTELVIGIRYKEYVRKIYLELNI